MNKLWNDENIQYVKDNYGKISTKEMSVFLGIKENTIRAKAFSLGINLHKKRVNWNNENVELLLDRYYEIGPKGIQKILGFPIGAITSKASGMGLCYSKYHKWDDEQDAILKKYYPNNEIEKIIKALHIDKDTIQRRAIQLKISKDVWWWSEKEISLLKDVYPHFTNKFLSENYFKNRSPENIRSMALKNNIHKTKEKACKWYDSETILKELKEVSLKINRTPLGKELVGFGLPSSKTFERYFGGYTNACSIIGIDNTKSIFGKPSILIKSWAGDPCYSYTELFITNFFIENGIKYEKEILYQDLFKIKEFGKNRMDWYLKDFNLCVEFFGMIGNKRYEKKMVKKLFLCKKYKINLLEIYPKNIDIEFLRTKFL